MSVQRVNAPTTRPVLCETEGECSPYNTCIIRDQGRMFPQRCVYYTRQMVNAPMTRPVSCKTDDECSHDEASIIQDKE